MNRPFDAVSAGDAPANPVGFPATIAIADYTYTLPEHRIAAFPLAERDESRLLVYKSGKIAEKQYRDLPGELPAGSLLVFNETRVIPARLVFQKTSGGRIEIFCLEPAVGTDPGLALSRTGSATWTCLVGGAAKWKNGQVLEKKLTGDIVLKATLLERSQGEFQVYFEWNDPQRSFGEILSLAGNMPIPPYLRRTATAFDADRYQTVYAKEQGSVAAPTAGLHFTPALLQQLQQKNIAPAFVTLHVGAGTFKPVQTATIGEHNMHAEWMDVSLDTIRQIRSSLGKIISVGTTSLRTLESLYWLGCKFRLQPDLSLNDLFLDQWEAYQLNATGITPAMALSAIEDKLLSAGSERLSARTQIMMAPGYQSRMITALITNFHQPQSTLLLLVAALIGEDWRNVYQYALDHDFRFLSYGDGSLLWLPATEDQNMQQAGT